MSTMYTIIISAVVLCLVHVSTGMTPVPSVQNDKVNGDFAFPDEVDVGKFSKSNYMHFHHHHHHPEFHHHHHHDWNEEGTEEGTEGGMPKLDENNVGQNSSMQIPLEFIQNINNYDVNDLLANFVEGDVNESRFIKVSERFGDDVGEERNAGAIMPKEAGCMPELTTVKIATSDDPSVLYIPQCTRVERCGGCCSHVLLSCQPQAVEYLNYKVIKTQYTGGKKLKLVGKEVVVVEKHTKCKCDCRIQPADCNAFQKYKQSECRCVCTNFDEEKKCEKNNRTKLWNPDLCTCQCRETLQCSTGSYFDQNECKCSPLPMRRRFARYEMDLKTGLFPVVPFDDD